MGLVDITHSNNAVTAGTSTSITLTTANLTVDQYKGRYIYFPGLNNLPASYYGTGAIGRITGNTAGVISFVDNVTGLAFSTAPAAAAQYAIGLLNRGQLLPRKLYVVQTTASINCTIEIVVSTPTTPVVLTGATFEALSTLGSPSSFAERDVSATAMTGGEVTFAFPLNAGAGVQEIDLSYFFPMLNTIRGNQMDILTVAIAGPVNSAYTVGASLICQEAMS
jgi:hypothetical protein